MKHLVVLTVLFAWGCSSPVKQEEAQSCQACHPIDPNRINAHLIAHSHDDVGWLKTFEQYYYGNYKDIANFGVQYIISSVVEALKADPDRRYVQVETAFFWKWWEEQTDAVRADFIELVNNGQIEIINAAWSMNDEAATNYQSTIDQFTYGLRTINDTLGRCGTPRVGWQIDPFGHSREQASIYSQLGYDGVFFARIDWADHGQRIFPKNLEVIWKSSANLDNSDIFTNVFPDFYYPPQDFCFDIECGDQVINDDIESADYNVPYKTDVFFARLMAWGSFYQTNNVLVPMGGDFQYQSAEKNFINTDILVNALKDNGTLNVFYSTPSCYIKAVNDAAAANNIGFLHKTDDFFPYGTGDHNYWTGYFTSRPNAKGFERVSNNILQAAKQLTTFSKVNGDDHEEDLIPLTQAVGILQHHDAITGTAKAAVANDYARLLDAGIKHLEPTLNTVVTDLLKKDASDDIDLNLQTCLLANISICEPTSSGRFVVSVYNPLERPVTHYVRLPVDDGTYRVTGPDGEEITDLLDSISSFNYVYNSVGTPKPKELVFAATDVPGLGLKLYYVERTGAKSPTKAQAPQAKFGTDVTAFEINDQTGFLQSVTLNGQTLQIKQEFLYYYGYNGYNNGEDDAASGAYIFRPRGTDPTEVVNRVTVTSTTGNLVDEVRQQVGNWITQIIRVYKGPSDNYIEFDWLVGPIEVDSNSGTGREIISRFTVSDFDSSQTFYTDSNGRELIRRVKNQRYDYQYDWTTEPVASNYYPVTSKILIRDENQNLEVAVLNDRSQGGSSLDDGVLELMVHRRLLRDDAKGVGEPLNDIEFGEGVVARGQHYLVIGSIDSIAAQERELALKKLLKPVVLVGDAADLSLDAIQSSLNLEFDGLQKSLPDNIHILTLQPWKEDSYLLRLEHILENNEDDTLSQSATVNLAGLFTLFEITEIRETTLGANEWLEDYEAREKYVWQLKDGSTVVNNKSTRAENADDFNITLNPMQIRTFVIRVAKN